MIRKEQVTPRPEEDWSQKGHVEEAIGATLQKDAQLTSGGGELIPTIDVQGE